MAQRQHGWGSVKSGLKLCGKKVGSGRTGLGAEEAERRSWTLWAVGGGRASAEEEAGRGSGRWPLLSDREHVFVWGEGEGGDLKSLQGKEGVLGCGHPRNGPESSGVVTGWVGR